MSGVSLEHKSADEAVRKGRARHQPHHRGVVRDTKGHVFYRVFMSQPCPTCGSTDAAKVPEDEPTGAPEPAGDPAPAAAEWEAAMAYLEATFGEEHPFGEATVRIGDAELKVAVAESPEQKAMGMTGRRYDRWQAMVFVQEPPAAATFHNRGVPQSTHVSAFDADGNLIEQFTMAADSAERVTLPPHKYAVETHGDNGHFPDDVRLVFS